MTVAFTPAHADYVTATRAYLARQPLTLLLVAGAGLLSAAMWLFFALGSGQGVTLAALVPAVVIPPALLALYLVVTPLVIASRARSRAALFAPTVWDADARRLHVRAGKVEAEVDWRAFERLIETKRYFILALRDRRRMFLFAPRRAFASAADEAAFRDLARRGMMVAAPPPPPPSPPPSP